ncbi:ATP-dependent helicase [bacterium]|nr:ATP-dependent helicase [bacterium]
MLIQGSSNTTRNKLLIEKYRSLIEQGVEPCEILVILLNPYKKTKFVRDLESIGLQVCDKSKIYTLNGLYYNAFRENSEYIKSIIKDKDCRELNQCGLEVSQYIFKQCIKEADFSDYISKVNLLHQLFRRYSLIVQNALSDEEIDERSKIVDEVFAKDAYRAIRNYKQKTIEYKSFDYLRQAAIFPLIYKNTDYFADIKYLIIDDADELPYMFWLFVDYITPKLNEHFIAYDEKGSSRCGYLCAYKSGVEEFKSKYKTEQVILEDKGAHSETATKLFYTIKNGKKIQLDDYLIKSTVNRLDMIDMVFSDVKKLISAGVKPHEFAIITPVQNDLLEKSAPSIGLNFQYLSGSEKLSDVKGIRHIISILKLVNGIVINDYEIKSLLINLLEIPYRKCIDIIKDFKKSSFKEFDFENDLYNTKYQKLRSILSSLQNIKYTISEQIKIIYDNLIKEYIPSENHIKYEFLLKEAQSFEAAFKGKVENFVYEFIVQIENSVISENPINSFNLKNNEIIISSPQKMIDFSINVKYQLWVDISNSDWVKNDTGTLYNAWVLNRDWTKKEYTLNDNIELTNDKTARVVRKLMLLAQNEVRFYSSVYDSEGNENFGGLADFISFSEVKRSECKIIPRDDQKPVLDYKRGKMGIMAVPGAGKTTILLALIMKLINSGISPENIFVLTYMESAAKNFKERIKIGLPDGAEIPNISTIHGLALRIIKENSNYIKSGLDENFEICDDSEKERIIKELFYKLKIQDDKYDNYLRGISIVKHIVNTIKLQSKYQEIQEFFNFFKEYNNVLKQKNLIDYDDMLRFAVQILRENKEIREYYQKLCIYIIEDEAQDSTEIQQTLINILSGKNNNVVRCGDINQSITATFTNSNLESFKKFINENNKVEMVSSQRCAASIYNLANKLVEFVINDDDKKQSFYQIKMRGTEKNPKSDIVPEYMIFEQEKEEKDFILAQIKKIQKEKPKSSIAILLRLNSDVNKYNEFITSNGIKTAIRTDSLAQKEIYKYIYAVLNIVENPFNNKIIKLLADLYLIGVSEFKKKQVHKFFENLNIPFININSDEIEDEILSQLYWDIDYWLNRADKEIEDIALNVGLYYSKTSVDKSNTYLISTFIRRLRENNSSVDFLKTLEYYAKKPMSAYKFFEDENGEDKNIVSIMTMHKSKGDEFDYVFIPQLNEDSYPVEIENVKLKSGSHFVETIKNAVTNCGIKTPDNLKKEQIEETLRLLYVGITRAKYGLFLSSAKHYLARKNVKTSKIIDFILDN